MKTQEYPDIPAAFLELFRDLVRAYQPRALDREAPRVYWKALGRYPIAILEASVDRLTQAQQFFPTTGEWYEAAKIVAGAATLAAHRCAHTCTRCGDRGLIRIDYHSGEVSDLAICDCQAGQLFRNMGEAVARANVRGLPPGARVAYVEHFDDEAGA